MKSYQAIQTKYLGPSNVRGSRVKAVAQAGSVTITWDYAKNSEQNHADAAAAFALKYGWQGAYYAGGLRDGGMVFVCGDLDTQAFVIAQDEKAA